MNYARDLIIDEHSLDEEWIKQPRLFMQYAKESAVKKREYDITKAKFEVLEAEIDTEVRSDPESYINGKITEKSIKNAVLTNADYLEAQQDLIDLAHELEIMKYAVRSFEQKKSALENLVKLHGQGYYSEPTSPDVNNDAVQTTVRKKKVRDSIKKIKEK